jgi:hypothetical protein
MYAMNRTSGLSIISIKHWLKPGQVCVDISADDYLRRPYTLELYVEFMEKHPSVGYAYCPAAEVENGLEKS